MRAVDIPDKPVFSPPSPIDVASYILRENYVESVTVIVDSMASWRNGDLKSLVDNSVEYGLRETGKPVGVVVIYER